MTTKDREAAESALRVLQSLGFEVKPLWVELSQRVETYERGTPTELDLRYRVPSVAPTIVDHLPSDNGKLPQVLTPEVMWAGYHYSLSPGQRKWFREFTGMTPSQTVTVSWVEKWPETQHPRAFKVVSDLHIDPRHRKHVISEFVIREPGEFFSKSAAFDQELAEAKEVTVSLHVGPCKGWTTKHNWAVEDLCGVKLKGEVAIVMVNDTQIEFTDEKGRVAKVMRDEWQENVADYQRLYKDGVKSRKRGGVSEIDTTVTIFGSLEEMTADLEKSVGGQV